MVVEIEITDIENNVDLTLQETIKHLVNKAIYTKQKNWNIKEVQIAHMWLIWYHLRELWKQSGASEYIDRNGPNYGNDQEPSTKHNLAVLDGDLELEQESDASILQAPPRTE